MDIEDIKQWVEAAEVMGAIKYCDEVQWLLSALSLSQEEVEKLRADRSLENDLELKPGVITVMRENEELRKKGEEVCCELGNAYMEIADLKDKLQAAEARAAQEHDRLGYALQDARLMEKERDEALRRIESLEALAAQHLADQELLVGRERKMVARECAEIAENHQPQEFSDGCGTGKFIARTIRTRYGLEATGGNNP